MNTRSCLRAFAIYLLSLGLAATSVASPGDHPAPDEHADHKARPHDDHPGHGEEHGEHEEAENGPNGGRLLKEGNVTVELAIFERGVPPQYRAWITQEGKPVIAAAQLTVELTRLGGKIERFEFTPGNPFWTSEKVVQEPHSFDVRAWLELGGKQFQWRWESYEGRTYIATGMAQKMGITTAVTGSGDIKRTVAVYGRVAPLPSQTSHVRARFPGVITAVDADIGTTVDAGDVLAEIESNESLKRYELRAPITGLVTERHANVGESTQDQTLFTIIGQDPLWAELRIFSSQRTSLAKGQPVTLSSGALRQDTTLVHVIPGATLEPFVTARAVVHNSEGQWVPGLLVKGEITIETIRPPLVVANRALQSVGNRTVVFVQVGEAYEIRPLELGRTDGEYTQVLSGLAPGDRYVVDNSYLVKADIEKSGAAHDH